jgi:hypothetical protein
MEIGMATGLEPTCVHESPCAERIAQLNDELRKSGRGGQIVITRGVHELTGADIGDLLTAVAAFNQFDCDCDPYGERDFGVFDFKGRKLMWKIDYYSDDKFRFGSNDAADPEITHRLLTVLLAEEY